jgi:hypothetical protein
MLPNSNVPSWDKLKLHEPVAVGCWYIWWQRREIVKGEQVTRPKNSAFGITALAANYGLLQHNAVEKEVKWTKPPRGYGKLKLES